MLRHFSAPTPRFGRANNRLPLGHQQRSPYYWWWAYLRRNEQYLQCCRAGGVGPLAALYADFGDVQNDNFHQWWTEGGRGVNLFAEQPLTVKFGELAAPSDWRADWRSESVMVVAVPLTMSKRALKGAFAALLDKRHTGHKAGRPSLAAMKEISTARYQLERNYTIPHLQTALAVFDMWVENSARLKAEQMTLWEIGAALNINRSAAKLAVSTHKSDRHEGRNVLAATVNRYVKQAKLIIEHTIYGKFPYQRPTQ